MKFRVGDRVLTSEGREGTIISRRTSLAGQWDYWVLVKGESLNWGYTEDELEPVRNGLETILKVAFGE